MIFFAHGMLKFFKFFIEYWYCNPYKYKQIQ